MKSPDNDLAVRLVGDTNHADFRDAVALIRATAEADAGGRTSPELIVIAQSRPEVTSFDELNAIQRNMPLAGIVALLGSWCEGETRTGRPWPGAHRLFWYEFPAWWQRQRAARAVGHCPDWARPANFPTRILVPGHPRRLAGLVVVQSHQRENADALADVLTHAGYPSIWQRPGRAPVSIRGAAAGIWDAAQLDECEAVELASFCAQMARDGAPVVALLDFPRRDRVDHALEIGAAAVLGKPWVNADLVTTLESIQATTKRKAAA